MRSIWKNTGLVVTGLLVGLVLAGPVGNASLNAVLSTQHFFKDGNPVSMEAYAINGNNYVKLRDVGELVGFAVNYDAATNSVHIGAVPENRETLPFPAGSMVSEDESKRANPAIFHGPYTPEIYRALRHTVLSGEESEAVAMSAETRETMNCVLAAFGEWPTYHLKSKGNGMCAFSAAFAPSYQEAVNYCKPFLESLMGKSDTEKAREIACFVCERLQYEANSAASPGKALTSEAVSFGNCMSYAHNYLFLCDLAGLPCVFVHSGVHQWNEVYADGRWWSADISSTDVSFNPAHKEKATVLCNGSDLLNPIYNQTDREQAEFAKEVLVPGSTR